MLLRWDHRLRYDAAKLWVQDRGHEQCNAIEPPSLAMIDFANLTLRLKLIWGVNSSVAVCGDNKQKYWRSLIDWHRVSVRTVRALYYEDCDRTILLMFQASALKRYAAI